METIQAIKYHILLVLLIYLIFSPYPSYAKHIHPEKYYQSRWCKDHAGQSEYVLPDKTRCACLTQTHAVEFDFAGKWYEDVWKITKEAKPPPLEN